MKSNLSSLSTTNSNCIDAKRMMIAKQMILQSLHYQAIRTHQKIIAETHLKTFE